MTIGRSSGAQGEEARTYLPARGAGGARDRALERERAGVVRSLLLQVCCLLSVG